MKVCVVQIITKLELGGAQEATLYIAKNLDPERYDVRLISGEGGMLTEEARESLGGRYIVAPELVREISPIMDARALLRLYGIIRGVVREADGPVVVHTHSSKAGILGRVAAGMAGARAVVHSIHGYGFNDFQSPFKRCLLTGAEKLAARFTDGFTADSQANIDKGSTLGLFRKAEAGVARCAISVDYFSGTSGPFDRSSIGVPEGAPLVTMVACLKPQKAPLDFVRVAARVSESVPDAHFVIAGDGELRGLVEAEIMRSGLGGRFHLLGWRRDVRDILHASDVVVLTSLWEGLPKVIPQAMAAGKPVVATAVDGTPEAVKDGVNGFLASPHDVGLMAQKTALLLRDKVLARRMGEAGRGMVAEFDEAVMLRRIEALYQRLLKEAA